MRLRYEYLYNSCVHADRELNVEFNISYTTLDEIE